MKFLGPPSSGSTAGTTFSHNRAGQYTRNRRTPVVGTKTPRQATVKANMTLASQSWQAITAAQQNAWISYATGHPIVDALGQSIKLTGSQYYIKCNAALLNVGAAQISDPPVSSSVTPEAIVAFQVDTTPAVYIQRATSVITDFVAIAMSKATSLGVNFQKTFRQIDASTADVAFFDETAGALTIMGTITVGTKAWLRLTPVNEFGLTGSPLIVQTNVIAPPAIAVAVLTSTVAGHITATWSGAPTVAQLYYQIGPAAIGPWGGVQTGPIGSSPQNITGLGSTQYARVLLQDTVTGLFGVWSAGHVIM